MKVLSQNGNIAQKVLDSLDHMIWTTEFIWLEANFYVPQDNWMAYKYLYTKKAKH